ncbi:hypothetical protein SAMN05216169_10565 [Anoxybacillus pushchinoensis]|uniref:Fur-regulated basic protein A n=1 Tax=Anoxybacillus pushchinoensis TaxID=150248 RepID=A0A1I0TY15_9BACL|nr:hypothetical protein SAMN05216169_10565 [Anoxybacillus pushchinoensis]
MGTLLQTTMKQKQFYIDKLTKGGKFELHPLHYWTVAELRKQYERYRGEIKNGEKNHGLSETDY